LDRLGAENTETTDIIPRFSKMHADDSVFVASPFISHFRENNSLRGYDGGMFFHDLINSNGEFVILDEVVSHDHYQKQGDTIIDNEQKLDSEIIESEEEKRR